MDKYDSQVSQFSVSLFSYCISVSHFPFPFYPDPELNIIVFLANACITLPIQFLRSGDRRNRTLTGSKTVLTVLTVRVFCS